ncbi:LytTR family DNA-binding domain-containing protein [Pedobacter sp. L105]|uniref:LytR/AlgR family response regulator transcription factor n=1 Tax=Pedobacter sp. L105 TaxID=1641871 RepID=UPI00131E434D|nr:LytTR family DNA-binding domain-containing protein [Pedobacter sp. L105]
MKIIIIEDERNTAEDLKETILKVQPEAQVVTMLHSVREAMAYFAENEAPDLLFCDIQLGDGTSFDILSKAHLKTPVIFCTAYDEFALSAFETHSIDYIMKPFDKTTVARAMSKYRELKDMLSPLSHNLILELLEKRNHRGDRMLVRYKDKILPVAFTEIALFYLENELVQLVTFEAKSYFVQKSLEELEKQMGISFYRINRQFLVNKTAIKDLSTSITRTITVNLNVAVAHKPVVSKQKAAGFLDWLI